MSSHAESCQEPTVERQPQKLDTRPPEAMKVQASPLISHQQKPQNPN